MEPITQSQFERHVPAFRDSESRTFEAIQPILETVCSRSRQYLDIPADATGDIAAHYEAYCCTEAAYEAVPQLDLILTDSGFAVVGNQNLSPASRERVAALRETLRRSSSDHLDRLLILLHRDDTWREAHPHHRTSLLYTPMIARRTGVVTPDGTPLYREEYRRLLPEIDEAQSSAASLVSQELADWLIQHQDEYLDLHPTDPRIRLLEPLRRLMAAFIRRNLRAIRLHTRDIQAYLDRHADEIEEYRNSARYQADHFKPYENTSDAPCFFFG